jgi:hypothetical protein
MFTSFDELYRAEALIFEGTYAEAGRALRRLSEARFSARKWPSAAFGWTQRIQAKILTPPPECASFPRHFAGAVSSRRG